MVIGPKNKLPKRVNRGKDLILVGDCTRKYRDQGMFIHGCPPHEPEPFWAIIDGRTYQGPEDMDFDLRARMAEEREIFKDYMKSLRDKSNGKRT
jgi:hypothetical protein